MMLRNHGSVRRQAWQRWLERSARLALGLLSLVPLSSLPGWAGAPLDTPLVLTQVPLVSAQPKPCSPEALLRGDIFEGARLVLVSPDGSVHVLSEGFHSACDPDLSFDAQRLLFAGKKSAGSDWHIYEVGLDGQGLRPVSPEGHVARTPIYLSTLFTLDSPQPWFTIAYGARQKAQDQTAPPAWNLFNIKLDGTESRRMTWNPNNNFDPFQMWDGRLIYAAEQHPLEPGAPAARVALFGIHLEGADVELYGGKQGQRIQHMPSASEKGLVVFVESDRATWDGAGQLACVSESRPPVTYRRLTDNPAWAYLYPSPWRDSFFLVSRRAAEGKANCGVFRFDPDRRESEPVFDSPDYHDLQAKAVRQRRAPDGHSTVVETKATTGILYGLNCYDADERIRPHLSPGLVKRVRLIEGVLPAAENQPPTHKAGSARRLIGEAPVELDGSFNLEVPASTPMLLQALDERGLALATCGWIWVQPKEKRGCIGCHEDPELIPENLYVQALRRPSTRLTLPPEQRRSVTFKDDVAPILKNRCALTDCHGGQDTPLPLPLQTGPSSEQTAHQAYLTLLASREGAGPASGPIPQPGRYADPGRARTSFLVWQIVGSPTARPWDAPSDQANARGTKLKPMPPPDHGKPLSPEEIKTIVQWIDLGAPWQAATPPTPPPSATQTQPQ